MKIIEISNNVVVRYESNIKQHFRELTEVDPDLKWHALGEVLAAGRRDNHVELQLDGNTYRFIALYFLKPSIPQLESILAAWTGQSPPLLVVPELSTRLLAFCRLKRLATIDLNGQVHLRLEGLFVDRRALPGRYFRFELEPRNIFVGKSARIVRSLLTDRDRPWTQNELVKRTSASSGLVSRITQHITRQNFIEKKGPRAFRLCDTLGLIDSWVKADDYNRRSTITRYTVFGKRPREIAEQLTSWAAEQSVPIAFTQWIAGWLRHPYTEPVVTSAYVAHLPEASALEQLGFRPVSDAGNVSLLVPEDEGVFMETQSVQGLLLASDAQIYLDLQNCGLRGPEQAQALRDWAGFCRP